jgi:acetyl-CoA carboxylase carboxyltransferase component
MYGSDDRSRVAALQRETSAAREEGGGAELIAGQHAKGKQTARERIEMLLDPARSRNCRLL